MIYRDDFIAVRREDVTTHGRLAPDMRLAFGTCAACAETIPVAVDPIDQPAYASVDELVASATRLAEELATELAGAACSRCDGALPLAEVAYHAWHAGLGRDLVVRWIPEAKRTELFTWEIGGERTPVTHLAPADEQRLVRSAALRADAMALEVFLFLNDKEIACLRPGVEPKLAHVVFAEDTLLLLLNEAIAPGGQELVVTTGDVIALEVTHPSGRAPIRSSKRSRATAPSPGPRFELAIDDEIIATVGNPGPGELSFEVSLFDAHEEVELTLEARGSDDRRWALPLLCAGQTATIRVLGPGLVDEP